METIKVLYNDYEFQICPAHFNFRWKGGGSPKLPPPAPPKAIPDKAIDVEDEARRKLPRGRRDTFLTGDLVPITEKKKKLG